jgi:hypothetical protein
MKKIILTAAGLLFLNLCAHAQVIIGFKVSPGIAIAHVKDNSSSFDGFTENEGNRKGFGLGANFDFPIQNNLYFGTGVWFTQKNLHIRNSVLGYSGTSNYNLAYLQVPILFKYRTGEVFTNKLNLVFGAGPILDLKLREAIGDGGDGAHYKHLADDNSNADPFRGSNGNGKKVPLFSPINLGLYISAGAEYQLLDKLAVCAGFSVNPSFLNMINGRLLFDYPGQPAVRSDIRITTTIVSLDLGIKLGSK